MKTPSPKDLGIGSIFDGSPDAIIVADVDTNVIVLWNPAAEKLFGYSAQEAIGQEVQLIAPEEFKPLHRAGMERYRVTGHGKFIDSHVPYEFPGVSKDGKLIALDLTLSKLDHDLPDKRYVVAFIRDISGRKEAEAALARSEQRFRTLADTAPVGIFQADRAGSVLYVNQQWRSLAGISSEEGLGFGWIKVLHPDDQERVTGEWSRATQAGSELTTEFRFRRSDGTVSWLIGRGTPMREATGQVIGYIGTVLDITDRKRLELHLLAQNERLLELDRLKTTFVNAVSHDLRTPITSIMGYAEFLEDGLGGPLLPSQKNFVDQIQTGALRLEGLVNDLLDFARLEAGTFDLKLETTDFGERARAIVRSFRPQALQGQIALEVELPEQPITVRMDADRIERVLANLIGNALKFTPSGGRIRIRAHVAYDRVRCEVEDTGIGIAPEDAHKLFQKFTQLEAGARKSGGMGLGLSISKAMVEAHGGSIGVQSAPGSGSTFWFELPCGSGD